MKISTKGRYAVRILAEIAKNPNNLITVNEIANNQNISIKYTEQIIRLLNKHNLLIGFRGISGGYKLSKRPSEYSICEILSATDDAPQIAPCLNHDCDRKHDCDTIGCWQTLNQIIYNYLSKITLQDILDKNYKNFK